jgi:hypothetical protein
MSILVIRRFLAQARADIDQAEKELDRTTTGEIPDDVHGDLNEVRARVDALEARVSAIERHHDAGGAKP